MKRFLGLLVCMLLLSGCTKSNIVNATEETRAVSAPDFEIQDDIEIDWGQVSDDTEELFNDESRYPYSRDYHFYLEPNKKEIMLMWVVADEFPDNQIHKYAEDLIKYFNDAVAVQDFSIGMSDKESYGGLWKDYALSFSIVPESTQDDADTWFISGTYGAGVDFVLPNIEGIDEGSDEAEPETEAEVEEETAAEVEMPQAKGPGLEAKEQDTLGPEAEKKAE